MWCVRASAAAEDNRYDACHQHTIQTLWAREKLMAFVFNKLGKGKKFIHRMGNRVDNHPYMGNYL